MSDDEWEDVVPSRAPKGIERPVFVAGKPRGLVERGNVDIGHRPEVENGDGSVSTVRSMGITENGHEVLIPTVHDDGYVMDDDAAVEHYRKTGRHLGKFDSRETSDAYGEALHDEQEAAQHEPSTRVPFYGPTQGDGDWEDVAPPKEQTSRLDAVLSGLNTGVPGAAHLGAGMQSAVDVAGGRRASLLEAYRANRAAQNSTRDAAQREHPGYFLAGNLPAAVGTGLATAAAIPARVAAAAGPIATDFLATLAPTVASAYSEGRGTPMEISKDMASGAVAGAGARVALRGVGKAAGAVLELPQKSVDAAAEWLGGTRIGKWLGEGADNAGSSARVKALKADVKASESFKPRDVGLDGTDVSARLAKAAHEGRADIDKGFTVDPKEFGDDFAKMSRDSTDEAVERFAHGKSKSETPVIDMEEQAKALRRPHVDTSKAEAELAADPRVANDLPWHKRGDTFIGDVPEPAWRKDVASKGDDTGGSLLREPGKRGRFGDADKPDRYRSHYDKNGSPDRFGDDAIGMDRARERQGWHEDSKSGLTSSPKYDDVRAKELTEAADAIKKRAGQTRRDEFDYVLRGARDKLGKAKDVDSENTTNATRLVEQAAKATDQIERIARGRETITKGATLGAAAAGGTKDLLTAGIGLAAGKQIGKSVLAGIDLAGEAGQRLAKTASLAEQWATRDDGLGRAARWALSAKGDAAIVRLMALAKLPEARDEQ